MNAVVINGSPRRGRGNTARVLAPFVEGMRHAGANVAVHCAEDVAATPCNCSEMSCWYAHPGGCNHDDGMTPLYTEIAAADTLVLATPVYIPLPGAMTNFLNRLCPLMEPQVGVVKGRTRMRLRAGVRLQRLALVSTGGWYEIDNFGTVVRVAEELAALVGISYVGAVLRPHAFLLERESPGSAAVLGAVRRAGAELARDGRFSPATLGEVARPLASRDQLQKLFDIQLARAPTQRPAWLPPESS